MHVLNSYLMRFWEDVREGEVLGSITMPVTITRCVLDAAATRDFFPAHHDHDYARSQNARGVYVNTMFLQGLVDRVGGEWAGPAAWLLRRKLDMVGLICVGDTIRTESRVVTRHVDQQQRGLVDIEVHLSTEHGLMAKALLTYVMPSRKESLSGS